MSEKLSAEGLENYRARLAVFDVQQCGVFTTEPMVRELLGHIAAQDEEIAQLRAVHEAELGVCEQHCEVVKRLRETLGRIAGCAGYPDDCEVECYNAMDGCEQRMAAMALGGEA